MKLTGVKQPVALEKRFASSMVDVASVVQIFPNHVLIEMGDGIDLGNKSDRDWAVDLVRGELKDCAETEVQIEILDRLQL